MPLDLSERTTGCGVRSEACCAWLLSLVGGAARVLDRQTRCSRRRASSRITLRPKRLAVWSIATRRSLSISVTATFSPWRRVATIRHCLSGPPCGPLRSVKKTATRVMRTQCDPTEGKLQTTGNISAESVRHRAVPMRDIYSHMPSSVPMTIRRVRSIC